jgi:biopolymer transport protein TolR
MGMSMGSGGGKAKRKRRRSVAEINVTPLVDVMLVLLVIFMITAPTLKEGFTVEIPQAEATQSVPIEDARLITVTPDGDVLKPNADTADQRYDKLGDLVTDLKKYKADTTAAKKTPVVVIVGDKNAKYERIIQVWNAVRTAEIAQVSFQLDPGAEQPNAQTRAGNTPVEAIASK